MESNGRRSARRTQWRRVAKHSNPLRVIFATKKCGGLKFGFAPALQVHESFFRRFPADASAWKDLASWHIDQGASEEEVERVYEDAIHNCCDVDLWLTYVQFLIEAGGGEETAAMPGEDGEQLRMRVVKAFEGAISMLGQSLYATPMWRAYLAFIRMWPEHNTVAKADKQRGLRKIYERCVVLPIDGVDDLFAEFGDFERSINEQAAQAALASVEHLHNNASAVVTERIKFWAQLDLSGVAVPPGQSPKGMRFEAEQLQLWRLTLSYEKNIPELQSEAQRTLRIATGYRYMLCALMHYPEAWIEFAYWQETLAGTKAALNVLRTASRKLPSSIVLAALLAETHADVGDEKAGLRVLRHCVDTHPGSDLAMCLLLRKVRRVEGRLAERKAFSDSLSQRKAGLLGYRVYLAHADIERRVNECPDVALRVFELGLRLHAEFASNAGFISAYVSLLTELRDDHNLRTLLRRLLGKVGANLNPGDLTSSGTSGKGSGLEDGNLVAEAEKLPTSLKLALWRRYLELEDTACLDGARKRSTLGDVVRNMRLHCKDAFELPVHLQRLTKRMVEKDNAKSSFTGVTELALSTVAVDAWARVTAAGCIGPVDTMTDAGLLARTVNDVWTSTPFLGLRSLGGESVQTSGSTVRWEEDGSLGLGLGLVTGGLVRLRAKPNGHSPGELNGILGDNAGELLAGALDVKKSAEQKKRARETQQRLQRQEAREAAIKKLPPALQVLMHVLPEPPIDAIISSGDRGRVVRILKLQRLQPRPDDGSSGLAGDGKDAGIYSLQDLAERRHLSKGGRRKRKRARGLGGGRHGDDDEEEDEDSEEDEDEENRQRVRKKGGHGDLFRERQAQRQRSSGLGRV